VNSGQKKVPESNGRSGNPNGENMNPLKRMAMAQKRGRGVGRNDLKRRGQDVKQKTRPVEGGKKIGQTSNK